MPPSLDSLPPAFPIVAALLVALKAWHGWRIGAVRQAAALVALVAAAVVAVVAAPHVRAPFGALLLGLGVYLALTILAAIVFKKTGQQSVGVIRFGYGFGGAALGAFAGLLLALMLHVAVMVAAGRADVLEQLRRGRFENALDAAKARPEKEPRHSRRH